MKTVIADDPNAQDDCLVLTYYDMFGRRGQITRREMHAMYRHPKFLFFLVLIVFLLSFMDVHGFSFVLSVPEVASLWALCVTILTALYFVFSGLLMRLQRLFPKRGIYFPLVGLVAMTITTLPVYAFGTTMAGLPFDWSLAARLLPTNLVLVLTFETFFKTFVEPLILQDIAADHAASNDGADGFDTPDNDAVSGPALIEIGGQKFRAEKILTIQSQGHYLEIVCDERTTTVRGRMADFVAQLPEPLGLIPHRSYWVAKSALDMQQNFNHTKILKLKIGTEIPIARSRQADVRQWLADHLLT